MFYLIKNRTEIVTAATEAHFLDTLKGALQGVEVLTQTEYDTRQEVAKAAAVVPVTATGDVVVL